MCLIGKLLSFEVTGGFVEIVVIVGSEALDGSKGLQQGSINREVIIGVSIGFEN